jgi:SAM-dependent methyltransferase
MTEQREEHRGVTDEPNRAQREIWADQGLQQYLQHRERWQEIWRPFGAAMFEVAALQPGEKVLDVGCGDGSATAEAARLVAPGGSAVGVDISAAMIDLAHRRAAAAGVGNVEFVAADAQTHPFPDGGFDAVISRFGVTFFADPRAAFANLARSLHPNGRLVFVCWQEPTKIEWAALAIGVAAAHVGMPDFGPPGAPGPFAMADGLRLRRVVEAGGFHDVTLGQVTRPHRVGEDEDDVVSFITSLDETRALFAGKPKDQVAAAVQGIREALAPHTGSRGVVTEGSAWLVSARL